MTSTQELLRWAEESVSTARRKKNLEGNPYDLIDSEPIATNFGNKFNRNAPYVKVGALDVPRGSATYTETIKYHDHERRIVGRNPLLFDTYGELVEEESSDEEGDKPEGEHIEENAYAGIHLEELLAPLNNAADLQNHPRLSRPYHDTAFLELIRNAEATLHREQEKLRALNEQFIRHRGDVEFVPVGDMHTEYDDWLRASVFVGTPLAAGVNGIHSAGDTNGESLGWQATANGTETIEQDVPDGKDADAAVTHEHDVGILGEPQIEATATASNTRDIVSATENGNMDGVVQGNGLSDDAPTSPRTNGNTINHGDILPEHDPSTSTNAMGIPDAMIIDTTTSADPPNTQRMTTRALANSTTSDETPPPVHPFFTHPPPKPTAPSSAPEEDPLGMLLQYCSKQAEIVRQWKDMHQGLLKSYRLGKEVLGWAKAEAHVGELSDNEDWVDLEEWGLKPDELKKGKDEDEEVQTVEGSGRRGGRGRRGGGAGGHVPRE